MGGRETERERREGWMRKGDGERLRGKRVAGRSRDGEHGRERKR